MKDYTNKSVYANQIIGTTTLTGKLCFYSEEFAFKADGVNSTIEKPRTKYSDIIEITKRNTLGFIPNGLTIWLKSGKKLNYVVRQRNDLIGFLASKSKA